MCELIGIAKEKAFVFQSHVSDVPAIASLHYDLVDWNAHIGKESLVKFGSPGHCYEWTDLDSFGTHWD